MINHEIEHDCGLESLRRWNQEQQALERTIARRSWIACLLAALAVLCLFILTAHGDMVTISYPEPQAEPAQGFDWASVFAWAVIIAAIALAIWQAAVSLPIIFNREK